jgi:hypothetical protein
MEYNEEGLAAARRFAVWNLGDPSWANEILSAYFYPGIANLELDEQMREVDN